MSTTATGVRSVTRSGPCRGQAASTSTRLDRGAAPRPASAIASRSTRASGSPMGTSAAARRTCVVAEHAGALDLDAVDGEHRGEEDQPDRADDQRQHGSTATSDPAPAPASGGPTAGGRTACGASLRRDRRPSLLASASVGSRSAARPAGSRTCGPSGHVAGAEGEHQVAGPGQRRRAAAGTRGQSGSKRTCSGGSGTASATRPPVTPGSGSSRAT